VIAIMSGLVGVDAQEQAELAACGTTDSAVVLDIVVRDREGRPVRDLDAADFSVLEDGVEQPIERFDVVSRPADARLGTQARPPLTVLAFDGSLGPKARERARDAALRYLDSCHDDGDVVGVLVLDGLLRHVAPFTEDPELIGSRIEEATGLRPEAARGSDGHRSRALGDLAGAIRVERRALEIEHGGQLADGDGLGSPLGRSLLAVVRVLGPREGRKAVVVFFDGSRGLAMDREPVPELIDAANRGNVSVYGVNLAGSSASSPSLPEALALATGGANVARPDDLERGLRDIAQDRRFHYLVSYTPRARTPDGGLRTTTARVRRPGVEVRVRSGYLGGDQRWRRRSLLRAIATLHERPAPRAFPLRAEAVHCPQPDAVGRVAVFVEVPAGAIAYLPGTGGVPRGDLTLLVRVADTEGVPRALLRRRFVPTSGPGQPASMMLHARIDLPPGRYELDAAAYDALGLASSVYTTRLEVATSVSKAED
jgi:VWFA-related protein